MSGELTRDEEKVRSAIDNMMVSHPDAKEEASEALWRIHEKRVHNDGWLSMEMGEKDRLVRTLLQIAARNGNATRLARKALISIGYEERNWPDDDEPSVSMPARVLPDGKGSPDPGGIRPVEESYPPGWLHALIHLNPETGEIHSDGDHAVRAWIEERIGNQRPAKQSQTVLLRDAPETLLRQFIRYPMERSSDSRREAETCIDGLVLQRNRAVEALTALREQLAAYWAGETDDVPREAEAKNEEKRP